MYKRAQVRAEECAAYFKRSKIGDVEEAAKNFIDKRGWKSDFKTLRLCKSKLTSLQKEQQANKRIISSEDQQLIAQIEEQEWPNIMIRKCGEKGTGIFAATNISKNALLCDYHGKLLSNEEGWKQYNDYGDTHGNVYMYQFEFGGKKYWIDAVNMCPCHPDKKTKRAAIEL